MTSQSDVRRLIYIRDAIALIQRRTASGRNAFFRDVDMQDAVLWRLETLAEATGKLSDELKQRHPETRRRGIYGFRNIAAYGYLDLQLDGVWEIIELYLADLDDVVDQKLRSELDAPHDG